MSGKGFDSFWDSLELLYVKDKKIPVEKTSVNTDTVEISDGSVSTPASTVIERKITVSPKKTDEYETVDEYTPRDSLIRRVKISKRKRAEIFYEDFCKRAREMQNEKGEACEYVPLNMYSPTYTSLNKQQMRYYLWWRENLKSGIPLKTDSGYIILLCEEIINLGADGDTHKGMKLLVLMWRSYYGKVPSMPFRLIDWICDYGLIHHLPPPNEADDMITAALSLKEYFLYAPVGSPETFTESLLKFCSSYDYTKSKFAVADARALYDKHVRGALCNAVKSFSSESALLSKLEYTNSKIERDSFIGILCSTKEKYRIECEYCSISCSGELRFLVGDIIKYSENKIRAHIGVKSKLSVYLISGELNEVLLKYFATSLTEPAKQQKKKEEKQPYDILYDQPKKQLSLSDAKRIEKESWKTTESLVEAFGGEKESDTLSQISPETLEFSPVSFENGDNEEGDLRNALGDLCAFVDAIKSGNDMLQRDIAVKMGKLPEALVDEINEVAVEIYGDILIEDIDGKLCIIEDYLEYLDQK